MNGLARVFRIVVISLVVTTLGACAVGPSGPYYQTSENRTYYPSSAPSPPMESFAAFNLAPNDQSFVLRVDDRTPFGPFHFRRTLDMLYGKGYDEARRGREADFSVEIGLFAGAHENAGARAGNTLGGALLGAAAGAIIGGALGDPGTGAAIGAASGGVMGFASPADTPLVSIDVTIYSLTDRRSIHRNTTVDLTHVPSHDVRHVIDNEVARLLQDLPRR